MKPSENKIEPSTEMALPDFVTPEEAFRKQWASSGADWAYFILQFLRGRRRLEIQPEEIVRTQLYSRSNDTERRALLVVCESEKEIHPSPEDERGLRSRDAFLMDLVDGRNLGHANWVAEVALIPVMVAERESFDRTSFRTTYESPKLFRWVWEKKQ